MGYKLAGCEVIGCCEIDKRMNEVYVANHKPKYNYLMDIRDFNKKDDLPEELYNLDILDGSPPCSTFSIAGLREDSWGVEKKFREGQKSQTLDDLLFVFIDTVEKLRPKVVIMENVEGLLLGNGWEYVKKIYSQFGKIGYKVTHKLLKGEIMGVPQTRHRVFFIATRLDFDLSKIDLIFNYEQIPYNAIKCGKGKDTTMYQKHLLDSLIETDKSMGDINMRIKGSPTGFTDKIARLDKVLPTITAHVKIFCSRDKRFVSNHDIILGATFPQDFNFLTENVQYICGMSVPPIMLKRVVERIIESGIFTKK